MAPSNPKNRLTIGRLARIARVNVETIRYYQRRGLLHEPDRLPGRFREYSDKDLGRLWLIRRAQEYGFTLSDIAKLAIYVRETNCHAIGLLAGQRLRAIEDKIFLLERSRRTLKSLLADCPGNCPVACPVIREFGTNGFLDEC